MSKKDNSNPDISAKKVANRDITKRAKKRANRMLHQIPKGSQVRKRFSDRYRSREKSTSERRFFSDRYRSREKRSEPFSVCSTEMDTKADEKNAEGQIHK